MINMDFRKTCRFLGCTNKRTGHSSLCGEHFDIRYSNSKKNGDVRSNFTEEEKKEIRRRMRDFENPVKLAKEFNTTKTSILRMMK